MAAVEIIGIHPIETTYAKDVYLIEIVVGCPAGSFSFDEVGQFDDIKDSYRQAVYDEQFLTLDGDSLHMGGRKGPDGDMFRAAFFLHYLNPAEPLRTSLGLVKLPRPSPMPERLARLVAYDPPT